MSETAETADASSPEDETSRYAALLATGERVQIVRQRHWLTFLEAGRWFGFERVELQPGESRSVTVTADPRLLARFDGDAGQWRIAEGTHRIALGKAADDLVLTAETQLTGRLFGR